METILENFDIIWTALGTVIGFVARSLIGGKK